MSAPFDHLDQITEWLKPTDIDVFELCSREGGLRLTRRQDGAFERSDLPPGFRPVRSEGAIVKSPGVGRFLLGHPLQNAPLVGRGSRVKAGQALGFLRIGMMLTPVLSDRHGVIIEVLASDHTLVGYGTPLFRLREV